MIQNFADIDNLSPSEFEVFVKDLLEAIGWKKARITKVGEEYKHGDGGIDIFAFRNDIKYGIEVKHRKKHASVDISALNQLVTGGELSNTKNLILVTNSYFTSEVRSRAIKLGVELIDREQLHTIFIEKQIEIGRSSIKPRKYQEAIITASLNAFDQGKDKIFIEMATGLGKTYTAALIVKEYIRKKSSKVRILFLVHQVELVMQAITSFKNVFGVGTYSFSACFDGDLPAETDFVFATFDTMYIHLNKLCVDDYDIVIVDEAHHSPARTYSEIINHLKPKHLIGMSATPFREDGKDVVQIFGGENGVICRYDLVWALRHNKLAFPKYMVILNDLDERKLSEIRNGFHLNDIDQHLFLNQKDEELIKVISRTIEENSIVRPKAIVFCRGISHIQNLIKYFKPGDAIFVHSKMDLQQRRKNINEFREGSYQFILVCDLFNEGIDIPETNILIFLRSTSSKRIWLQQLGRGLRKTTNKDFVHVLDFVGSIERINDVKELKQSIKKCPLDINEVSTKEFADTEEFWDNSIEVKYSHHAAQVLSLLEENAYKLSSRSRAIEALKEYYEEYNDVPSIIDLSKHISSVSPDQISTLFGSYYAYIRVSLPELDIKSTKTYADVLLFVDNFISDHGIHPLPDTILLQFKTLGLHAFTLKEIAEYFPEDKGHENSIETVNETLSVLVSDNEVGNKYSDEVYMLLMRYHDKIYLNRDLMSLDKDERCNIRKAFVSEFKFIRMLEEFRAETKLSQ